MKVVIINGKMSTKVVRDERGRFASAKSYLCDNGGIIHDAIGMVYKPPIKTGLVVVMDGCKYEVLKGE